MGCVGHHRKTCFERTSAPVIGSWISGGLGALGLTLPSYIGAMLVGAPIRNVDDHLGWFGLSPRSIEVIGNAALSLFLVVALMDLHLWDLAGLATPLPGQPRRASDRGHGVLLLAAVAPDGTRLRRRRHRQRLRRLHAGHDGECRGGDEFADRTLRPCAARLPGGAYLGAFLIDFTNAIVITIFINGWS